MIAFFLVRLFVRCLSVRFSLQFVRFGHLLRCADKRIWETRNVNKTMTLGYVPDNKWLIVTYIKLLISTDILYLLIWSDYYLLTSIHHHLHCNLSQFEGFEVAVFAIDGAEHVAVLFCRHSVLWVGVEWTHPGNESNETDYRMKIGITTQWFRDVSMKRTTEWRLESRLNDSEMC